jgi:hypothetical protein
MSGEGALGVFDCPTRVGISNRRLVSLDARGVTFRTKDGKTAALGPVAFLMRFVEHTLPAGFVKIRHYGLLAPSNVSSALQRPASRWTRPARQPLMSP